MLMNVYIEYVIADNFVIDALLLWAAALTLRLPYKKYRIVLGGLAGAACAVVSVFVTGVWTYLVKTVCLIAMCVTAIGFGKKLFWYILLTVAYTFVLGGAIVAIFHFCNISYLTPNGEFYQLNVPLFVYVLAAAIVVFLCYSVIFYLKQAKRLAPYIVKAVVKLDKDHCVTGYCDSGNTLTYNGVPVCFVTKRFSGFADYFAKQTLSGNVTSIEVVTVAGSKNVSAVKAAVTANGLTMDVYLALPAEKCQSTYNILLSNAFLSYDNAEQHDLVQEKMR